MVPVVSKPGIKPKPPTPPKPIHYLPVNYKRLIDSKYTSSSLLQVNNNNNYDSLLDRSLTDDTAPLIEEEAERAPPAIPNRTKPPLLPKPQHILPPRTIVTTAICNVLQRPPELQRPTEEKKRLSTNPFVEDDDHNNNNNDNNNNDFEERTPKSPALRSTNPFENLELQQQETTTTTATSITRVEEKFRSLNPFEGLSSSPTTTTTTTNNHCDSRSATQNFDELLTSRWSDTSCGVFETSCSSIVTTSLENSSIFKQLSSTHIESSDFCSLEEIHKQFNSDKECLIDRGYSSFSSNSSSSKVVRKHLDHSHHHQLHQQQHDRSNRSSWKSNSDLETEDDSRSRSSSSNNDTSVNGSPIIGGKSKESGGGGGGEKTSEIGDDDSTLENNNNNSTEHSYSVQRRIKTWFGSFGKGNKAAKRRRRERRDSKFYVDSESENKNGMWETASISSGEEKNESENTTGIEEGTRTEDAASVTTNGNCEPCLTELQKREKKAFCVIQELISSEKVFIDVLKLLTEDFVAYVRSVDRDSPVIPEGELVKIINYLPQLRSFNEELLRDFENRIESWSTNPKISDIMIKKGPFLKLFSTYIQNFENQCALLDDCCHKYNRFGKAVKNFEALDRCKKLTLKHYMLKPIQRLPQYRLMLEEYLSRQTSDSLDYDDTQQALSIVCDAAEHANRSVEQGVSLSKLLQLQSQLGHYEIIGPGREFVKSGELYKLSRKEMQLRYFILLNDCLLYTNYYGSMFSLNVKDKLPLGGMKVYLPPIEDYHNEFNIISTKRSFTLRASSSDEREAWVSALETTIKEHNRKQLSFSPQFVPQSEKSEPLEIGKEAPIWVPDSRVTMCQVCTAEFKLIFRRHHCRACGRVVCSYCSDNKAPLQYMHFRAERVCDVCYQYLLKEFVDPGGSIMTYIMEQSDLCGDDPAEVYEKIKKSFRKHDPSKKLPSQDYPQRLKETANDSGSVFGWLQRRKARKSWKRYWFKLKEQVLFVYRASDDKRALETIPVLGYQVETFKEVSIAYEDIDSKLVFQLAHVNQDPLVFYADTEEIADRWITALREAVSI